MVSSVSTAERSASLRLPDGVAFWATGGLVGLFLFAAAAPSPLYGTYAGLWGFSASTLTVIFAVYAAGLLAGLLVTGRLSDHVGRKPVVMSGIVLEIVAMLLFVVADSTLVLGAARTVQGVATGVVLGALAAQLIELASAAGLSLAPVVNSAAPTAGLAAGAIGSGALVQYAPSPLRLVYWLLVVALVVGLVVAGLVRETGVRRAGAVASLRPVVGLHADARPAFAKVLPSLVALWALAGFYLSLGPGLMTSLEGSGNLLWGGVAIFGLCASAAVSVVVARDASPWTAMLVGCAALFIGVALTALAIAVGSGSFFLATTVVAGVGFGLSFLGALRAITAVTPPAHRAGTLATLYVVSYTAFSVPVVVAGIAETHASARTVALVFSAAVAVLAAIGLGASAEDLREARARGRAA